MKENSVIYLLIHQSEDEHLLVGELCFCFASLVLNY